jgi:hypothetical protein
MGERTSRISIGDEYRLVADLIESARGERGKARRIDDDNIVLCLQHLKDSRKGPSRARGSENRLILTRRWWNTHDIRLITPHGRATFSYRL